MNRDLLKLSQACLAVMGDVQRGKIRMRDLRRSHVFFDNGTCGCAFGHAILRAGLKQRLAPFHTRTAAGKIARWHSNVSAYGALAGLEPTGRLVIALEELEMANDIHNGEKRKIEVVAALKELSGALVEAAT